MSQEKEYLLQIRDASEAIAQAITGHGHRAALAALLSTFQALAAQSPCCQAAAAAAALQCGADLTFNPSGPAGPLH